MVAMSRVGVSPMMDAGVADSWIRQRAGIGTAACESGSSVRRPLRDAHSCS